MFHIVRSKTFFFLFFHFTTPHTQQVSIHCIFFYLKKNISISSISILFCFVCANTISDFAKRHFRFWTTCCYLLLLKTLNKKKKKKFLHRLNIRNFFLLLIQSQLFFLHVVLLSSAYFVIYVFFNFSIFILFVSIR